VDLELNTDQRFFQETTRKFLESEAPIPVARGLASNPDGFERSWWRKAAELGWTSLLVPEEFGGGSLSGGVLADLSIVAEELGRVAAPGPFLATNVVAAGLVVDGSEQQRSDVLAGIMSGDVVATWCMAEPARRFGDVGLQAERRGGAFILNGRKTLVEAGAQADQLLVTARVDGGLTQFLVPAGTPGVDVEQREGIDLTRRYAVVTFTDAELGEDTLVGAVGAAGPAVDRQWDVAVALQCAEMVGAAGRVLEFTVEYAFDRYTFGRPLASYQALKHRFADMKMWYEASCASTAAAARAVDAGADDSRKLVSVAKAYVGDKATDTIQDCVQMHGGIGVTYEHDIHLYLRRVALHRQTYGTPDEHRERIATAIGM
jgi:alkylation response protein AidB-like acyl-CoA dehydrogenase